MLNELDGQIEQARDGINPFEIRPTNKNQTNNNQADKNTTNIQTTTTESEDTTEDTTGSLPETISKENYALLSNEEKKAYSPVPRTAEDRLMPGGGWIKDYKLKPGFSTKRDRYSQEGLSLIHI